jgi:hypothetical protein
MYARSSVASPHSVFEALADPSITTRFWYTKSSGRMEEGPELAQGDDGCSPAQPTTARLTMNNSREELTIDSLGLASSPGAGTKLVRRELAAGKNVS